MTKRTAAGAGPHMTIPAVYEDGSELHFAFIASGGQPYYITAEKIDEADAKRWIAARIKGFSKNPGSRESFAAKIHRKVIAAHGSAFVKKLRAGLDEHGKMELDMMLSPDSHSSTVDETTFQKIAKDPKTIKLRTDRKGKIQGPRPRQLQDNLGSWFREGPGRVNYRR